MPCKEIFDNQDKPYQDKILARDLNKNYLLKAIEAVLKQGWREIIGASDARFRFIQPF